MKPILHCAWNMLQARVLQRHSKLLQTGCKVYRETVNPRTRIFVVWRWRREMNPDDEKDNQQNDYEEIETEKINPEGRDSGSGMHNEGREDPPNEESGSD